MNAVKNAPRAKAKSATSAKPTTRNTADSKSTPTSKSTATTRTATSKNTATPEPATKSTAPPKTTLKTTTRSSTGLNIKKLAKELEREIAKREKQLALPEQNLEIGTRHLMWMCRQVYSEWVPEALAPIWVGYVQGVLRVGGGPNVKELAAMIREAREEVVWEVGNETV